MRDDKVIGSTVRIDITTHDSTGALVAPSSAFAASDFRIYKDGSATEKATTNGITVTSPFDSITGKHLIEIDTGNETGDIGFWASGSEYRVELNTAKTISSIVQSGVVVGRFVLVAAGVLRPTVDGRTLVVSAGGAGDAALDSAARVKLDATQPDYVPATAAALATAYALLQLTDADVAALEARVPSDPADQSAVESAITVVSAKIGTPAGASVSADIASIKTDTGTTIPGLFSTLTTKLRKFFQLSLRKDAAIATDNATELTELNADGGSGAGGYLSTTDSLEAIKDATGSGTESDLMVSTTIATLTSQTVFTLTAGSPDNDAYNDQLVVVTDASTSTQKSRGIVSDYVGSTKTVTLRAAPGFTIAAGDTVSIIAIGSDVSSSQLASAISSAVATAGVSTTVTGIPTFLRVGDARTVANGGAIAVRLYDADDDSLLFGLGTQLFEDATITFSLRRGGNDGTEGTEEAVIPCTWVASGGDGYVQIAYEGDALDDCDAMDKLKEKDCHRWGIKFQWGDDDPITPVYGTVSVLRKIVSTQ